MPSFSQKPRQSLLTDIAGLSRSETDAVLLAADDDGLRILERGQVEPLDEPGGSLQADRRAERRDRVAGVVGPRESGDGGLPGARLHHLLDHRIVADDRGAAHRRQREAHLLAELLAQGGALIGDLSAKDRVEERGAAADQRQTAAEHEPSREGEIAPPEPGERKIHYWSSTFTRVVR